MESCIAYVFFRQRKAIFLNVHQYIHVVFGSNDIYSRTVLVSSENTQFSCDFRTGGSMKTFANGAMDKFFSCSRLVIILSSFEIKLLIRFKMGWSLSGPFALPRNASTGRCGSSSTFCCSPPAALTSFSAGSKSMFARKYSRERS